MDRPETTEKRHADKLRSGVTSWNEWRKEHPEVRPNLDRVDLRGLPLEGADLYGANLEKADLRGCILRGANLRRSFLVNADGSGADFSHALISLSNLQWANLAGANFAGAELCGSNLTGTSLAAANLRNAELEGADLTASNLANADLSGANLECARLVAGDLSCANLNACRVYGVAAWDLELANAKQSDLVITDGENAVITVDSIEVAQFVHLLLSNAKIRDVIDTITTKAVLVLGRFSSRRKPILDALRASLRNANHLPLLFDFKGPASRTTHETVTTLARLAKFILADITSARSIPQELVSIVESLPSVPVQPLLALGSRPWGMYDHISRYPWVLPVMEYRNTSELLTCLPQILVNADLKARELRANA